MFKIRRFAPSGKLITDPKTYKPENPDELLHVLSKKVYGKTDFSPICKNEKSVEISNIA